MDPTSQCLYASKPCENPRSMKENGQLHRLCMFHRIKANDAQRRWHSRQKTVSSESVVSSASDDEPKAVSRKRRRAKPATSTEESSGCENSELPAPRRRHKTLAKPHVMNKSDVLDAELAAPLATHFTNLLVSATAAPPTSTLDVVSDEELAQLSEFIVQLDESKLMVPLYPVNLYADTTFEREWWLANQEASVYCL